MTDATTEQRPHAHDHVHDHAHDHASGASSRARPILPRTARVRPGRWMSLLEASAGVRLSAIFPLVALLWAGVYWALH